MREREQGTGEGEVRRGGGGEANGGKGRVEQMAENGRERETVHTHTPLSVLSVDRLILTWLERVCCGVVRDTGIHPVLRGNIT